MPGGVMVIPDEGNRKLIICGGKDRVIFLINRDYMGKYGGIHHKWILPETAIGSPAITAIPNNCLILGWTGTDFEHHVNIATSNNAASLKSKFTMNETSIAGPGVTFGNAIVLVSWLGADIDHHLNVVSSNNIQLIESSPNKRTLLLRINSRYSSKFAKRNNKCSFPSFDLSITMFSMSSMGDRLRFIPYRP
jgi:hypothetical protein